LPHLDAGVTTVTTNDKIAWKLVRGRSCVGYRTEDAAGMEQGCTLG